MSESIVITAATTAGLAPADLGPAPIPREWILDGAPEARNKHLVRSHDRTASVIVWNCTVGRFTWHYSEDETLVILSGEAFITDERGQERRLGPGDMGFFPAGSCCTWRVTSPIRKVAVVRRTIPRPVEFALRAWNKLLRVLGVRSTGLSPLTWVPSSGSTAANPA